MVRVAVRIPPQPGVYYTAEAATSMVGTHMYIGDGEDIDIGVVIGAERRLRGAAILLVCDVEPHYRVMAETGTFRLGRGKIE